MKNIKKKVLSNTQKNELLKRKNYQDVELYCFSLGKVYCYMYDNKKDFHIKNLYFNNIEDVKDLENGYYLLTHSDGDKRFLHLEDMNSSDWFKSYEDLENGYYLLTHFNGDKQFLHLEDMESSDWLSFKSYEDLENGYYLLTHSDGDKRFLHLEDMKSSDWFSFEDYKKDNQVCISRYGSKAKLNLETLKLGSWYFE